MTEHETIPGAVYAVEAEGHIQVINPAGVVVYEGENALSFPAVHASYDILPEGAAVRQVFKLAPRTKLHLLMGGAGGWLPKGFTDLKYLESSGTQYILVPERWATDYTSTESSGVKLKGYFTYGTAVNGFVAGALWGCVVNANSNGYIHNSTHHISGSTTCVSVGYWGASSYTKEVANPWMAELNFRNSDWRIIESGNGDVFSVDALVKTGKRITISECNYQGLFCLYEAVNAGKISNKAKGVLYWAKFSQGAEITRDLVPVLDASGTPCMFDKVSKQCFYNSGTGSFIAGLTMKQIPALRRLPAVTSGELKLSLPWEAQLIATGAPAILESVKNRGWTLIVQYADPDTESAVYNKYAACKTVADMRAVNPDYKNDLTVAKEWVYPTPSLERAGLASYTQGFFDSRAESVDFYAPIATELNYLFFGAPQLREAHVYAPNAADISFCFRNGGKLTEVTGDLSNVKKAVHAASRCAYLREWKMQMPKLTDCAEMFYASKKLEDVQTEFPALEKGSNMFYECILNKESVIRVANSLPTWTSGTHEICFGIHVDHQSDEELLAVLEAVEAKGWTLTVQWNGTATAAATTYGLRRPPIYAKLAEPREEQMLDWGHYVTNWEENGYTEFASLEEAYTHFNLKMPE